MSGQLDRNTQCGLGIRGLALCARVDASLRQLKPTVAISQHVPVGLRYMHLPNVNRQAEVAYQEGISGVCATICSNEPTPSIGNLYKFPRKQALEDVF